MVQTKKNRLQLVERNMSEVWEKMKLEKIKSENIKLKDQSTKDIVKVMHKILKIKSKCYCVYHFGYRPISNLGEMKEKILIIYHFSPLLLTILQFILKMNMYFSTRPYIYLCCLMISNP